MIIQKVNILQELKKHGYSSYYIQQNKLFGNYELTKIRNGGLPSWNTLNLVCSLCNCQPGDLLEYIPDADSSEV